MRIKLLKPHRHAGINYTVGTVIDVELDTANYLADMKVATPAGDTTVVKNQSQSESIRGRGKPTEYSKDVASIPTVDTPVDHEGSNQPMGDKPNETV